MVAIIAHFQEAAFDRVPDSAGLDFWVNSYMAGTDTLSSIAQKFTASTEYATSYPSYLTNTEYVARIYTNVFNRAADTDGQTFWVNHLVAGTLTRGTLMKAMVDAAAANSSTDGAMLANQASFGVWAAVNQVPFATANAQLSSITSVESTLTAAQTAVGGSAGQTIGQAFALTAGVDAGAAFTGTDSNDIFNATVTATFNALDTLDGGAGNDTLNVLDNTAAVATAGRTVTNIETANFASASTVTANTTAWTGLTALNVTQATTASVTAAATTDVNVSGLSGAATVTGGAAQTVTAVGQATLSGAAGAVSATVGTAAALATTINGGTSVNLTVTGMTENDGVNSIVIGNTSASTGAITVTASGSLTDAGAAGADSFSMGDMAITGGSTVTVTQSAGITDAQKTAALTAVTNDTVTQGDVVVTGGAATTSVTVVQDAAVTALNTAAPGNTANKIGVVTGSVTINDKNATSATAAATISTVSLSNYNDSTISSNALSTLNLSGTAGTLGITTGLTTPTNTTLALNVNGLSGTNAITDSTAAGGGAGYTVLNVNATGANSTIAGIAAVDVTTLNVAGDKSVEITTAAGMTGLTTISVAGSAGLTSNAAAGLGSVTSVVSTSTGTTSVTVDDSALTVTGAGGVENITYKAAIAATAKINLGAGNDTLTIAAASVAGATITGGEGTDTLVVADGDFIDGAISYTSFEIADITGAAAGTLNMANLASATQVVAKGTYGTTALTNVAAGTTVSLTSAASTNTTTTGTLSYALADFSGLTDSLSISLNSLDTDTNTATTDDVDGELTVTALTANGIETLNFDSNASTTDGNLTAGDYENTITTLTATGAKTINVTGAADFTIGTLTTVALTKFDAHLATGDIDVKLSAPTGTVAYLGSSAVDTVDMTSNVNANNIIQGNGGADIITLAAAGTKETVKIAADTDSVLTLTDTTSPAVTPIIMDTATGYDKITNFTSGEDKIELSSALGLATGDARTAIAGKGTLAADGGADTAATIAATLQTLIGTGADFFNDGTADRAVASVVYDDATAADDFVMLFIDTNADGNFTNGVDQAIMLTGTTTTPVITDIVFG